MVILGHIAYLNWYSGTEANVLAASVKLSLAENLIRLIALVI